MHFCPPFPAHSIHSSILPAVPKTTPQVQPVVRAGRGGHLNPIPLWFVVQRLLFFSTASPSCHVPPLPPPCCTFQRMWFLWAAVDSISGDPDLDCGVMELVLWPLPAPAGPPAPSHLLSCCVISWLCFALWFFVSRNKQENAGKGGHVVVVGDWQPDI